MSDILVENKKDRKNDWTNDFLKPWYLFAVLLTLIGVGFGLGIAVGILIEKNKSDDDCTTSSNSFTFVADTAEVVIILSTYPYIILISLFCYPYFSLKTPPSYWVQGTGLAISFSYNIEEGGQSSPMASPPLSQTDNTYSQYNWGGLEGTQQ